MKILYILLLVALVEIQSKELDPGPQPITEGEFTRPSTQPQKRYATKEIILYLTPSQIKALQTGEATISSSNIVDPAVREQDSQRQLTFKENEDLIREQFENIKAARVIPVHEQQEDNFEINRTSENPSFKQEQQQIDSGYLFKKYEYEDSLRQQQSVLQKLQFQELDPWNQNKPESQSDVDASVDFNSALEKKQEEILHEQFKEKWNRILELNRKQIKALTEQPPLIKKPEEPIQVDKPLLQLQYPTKYNDQKNAIDIEKFIRERHQEELDRQSALVRAETIANASPKLLHQEVTITKHRRVPVARRVNVPLPTPVLDPISEAYRVKIPQHYPVKIFRHIPVPVGTEHIEDEKQNPVNPIREVRPFTVQKNVPYSYETNEEVSLEIPTQKTEKVTAFYRPYWKY